MKFLPIVFLLLIIPITVDAIHQNQPCNVSVNGQYFPISYNGEVRNNPDNSFYPGDGFHYLFLFQGSDTCHSFSAQQLQSEGSVQVLTHYSIIGPNSFTIQKNSHSHNDFNIELKYLLTKHYYVDRISYFPCGSVRCSELIESETPSFSIREDQEIPYRLKKLLDGERTASTYSLRTEETYDWGFGRIGVDHTHDANPHKYEDEESIEQFENYFENMCSNLEKNQGCVFGHAEIDVEINPELCLYTELEKHGISVSEQSDDVCIMQHDNLQLDVKGTKIVCENDNECKTISITWTKYPPSSVMNILFIP